MLKSHPREAVVVLVDDEPMVTRTLAAFLELETDYQVETFQDPREALAFLQGHHADVVVSDFMMPEMNGLEFLTGVRDLDPDLPRVMLTGYADKENAIRAINEVGLFQYLEKPLDNDLFMLTLTNAIRHRSLQTTLLEKIKELDHALRQRDELSSRDEAISREMDWARTVQNKFLPEELPSLPGWDIEVVYRPSMAVGGDYYDFVPLAEGRWAIVVADSAGHGVQAALGTALLKFATGSVADMDLGPGEIMAALNAVLFQGLPRDIPVAAAVAVIDPTTGQIRLVGGGLPQAYLLEQSGEVLELPAAGLLLGLVDQTMYNPGKMVEFTLEPGQRLLMFSDGLTEAQNSEDDFFGEGPLQELIKGLGSVPTPDLAQRLTEAALEYGLAENRDDLTLVALGRSGARTLESGN
jgi:phosphoserine phosphatase RsbU/P